jgi:hypothetical protein
LETARRSLWEWWKRVARRIGDFQARLILLLFYFLILGPFALAVRWGSDPLAIKAGNLPGWRPRAERAGAPMARATQQF